MLDAFGRLDVTKVAGAWSSVVQIEADLMQAKAGCAAERDRDYLAHSLAEIDALAPEAGEETRLAEERAAMQAGIKAGESLTGSMSCWADRTGRWRSCGSLHGGSNVARPIIRSRGRARGLDRALIEAAEAEDKIARAADELTFDPARLEAAEARLFEIRGLARKHRVEPDALAELADRMRAQLSEIEAGGERIAELDRALERASALFRAAAELSRQRIEAASKLDEAVAGELHPLKLDAARFRTALAQAEPGSAGTDKVEFEDFTNPDHRFRTADQDRQRRASLALHPRAKGCIGWPECRRDDLRRDRSRRRRRGRQRDR